MRNWTWSKILVCYIFVLPLFFFCLFTLSVSLSFSNNFSSEASWLLHLWIYISSRRQHRVFEEKMPMDWVFGFCDAWVWFLSVCWTEKKFAEIGKEILVLIIYYLTSEFLYVGKWGIIPWKGGFEMHWALESAAGERLVSEILKAS